MSLFTAALGGLGRSAEGMASAYIKDELARQSQAELEGIRAQNQRGIEELRARLQKQIQEDKERLAALLRAQEERNRIINRITLMGGQALGQKAARALDGDTTVDLTPEDQNAIRMALSDKIFEGDRFGVTNLITGEYTPTELGEAETKRLEAQAKTAEERADASQYQPRVLSGGGKQRDTNPDWLKAFDVKFFTDDSGRVDHSGRAFAIRVGQYLYDKRGAPFERAVTTALELYQKAIWNATDGGKKSLDRAAFAEELSKVEAALYNPKQSEQKGQAASQQKSSQWREPPPESTTGQIYGPLTPWSKVEEGIDRGDRAAFAYLRQWLNKDARFGHMIGLRPPQSLIEKYKIATQSMAAAAARK